MMFLMRLPAASGSVHPGLAVPCCAPVMCAELAALLEPKAEVLMGFCLFFMCDSFIDCSLLLTCSHPHLS